MNKIQLLPMSRVDEWTTELLVMNRVGDVVLESGILPGCP